MIHIHIVLAVRLQCSGQACEKYAEDHGFKSMHFFELILKSERTSIYQYVLVHTSMFLINTALAVQGSTWQYQTEHGSTKWYDIVIYGMNWYVAVHTGMYQSVKVNWHTMFLINRCMYCFVLVCTDTYHYVKLTQQYVWVCILLLWYKQVCRSM